MLPSDFEFRNLILEKPKEMTDEECMSLPVWTDGNSYISCWKLNKEEMDLIKETGTVYIQIFSHTHPPILPHVECPLTFI